MQTNTQILELLRAQGFRITKIRKLIVEIFANSKEPISAVDIVSEFQSQGIKVNKTTIYREISSLISIGVLKEISFGDSTKRYEVSSDSHHHHLICIKCKKIEDVELHADLDAEEKRIAKEKNFQIQSHSLEFFGLCNKCSQ